MDTSAPVRFQRQISSANPDIYAIKSFRGKSALTTIRERKLTEDNKHFWQSYICQINERLDLSGIMIEEKRDVNLKGYKSTEIGKVDKIIENRLYVKIKELCGKNKITVNALLQFCLHKALSVYGNNKQTVVGTSISDMNLPTHCVDISLESFLNILPFIVSHRNTDETSVINAIKAINASLIEINTRSKEINLSELQKDGDELFEILFIYDNFDAISNYYNYPLCFAACEDKESIKINLFYATELFTQNTMKGFLDLMQYLIEQTIAGPYQKVKELKFIMQKQEF